MRKLPSHLSMIEKSRPAEDSALGLDTLFQGSPDAIIPSSALFRTRREITISHGGAFYRMRITRQGKLILNK